jgi:hypothetical protein
MKLFKSLFFLFAVMLFLFSCSGNSGKEQLAKTRFYYLKMSSQGNDTIHLLKYDRKLSTKCTYRRMNYMQNGADVKICIFKTCPEDTAKGNLLECYTDKYGIIFKNDIKQRTNYFLRTSNDSVNWQLHQLIDFMNLSPP